MIKEKMKLYRIIYLLIITLLSQYSYAQKSVYIPIRSAEGRVLVVDDSLSFQQENLSSQYYVDSINRKPFTGLAIIHYGKNAVDSLNITEGVKNGWQKTYFNENGKLILGNVTFYNQLKQIKISSPVFNKKRNSSAFAIFYFDSVYYYFEIKYKKTDRIIVKQLISLNKNYRSINKLKFNSLIELAYYFINFDKIYKYCEMAGFFGKPENKLPRGKPTRY